MTPVAEHTVPKATAMQLTLSPQFSNMIPSGHNHARVAIKNGQLQFLPTSRKEGNNLPAGEVFADLRRIEGGNQVQIIAVGLDAGEMSPALRAKFGNHGWNILSPVDGQEADVMVERVEVNQHQPVSFDKTGAVVAGRRRGRKPKFLNAALRSRQAAAAVLDGESETSDLSVDDLTSQVSGMIMKAAGGDMNLARKMALTLGTNVIDDVIENGALPEPIALPATANPKELS